MPEYQHAIIVTIQADTYELSLCGAEDVADVAAITTDAVNASAVLNYGHDNDGQRVLYLPAEGETA